MRLLIGAALGASVAEGGIATFAIVIFRDVVGAKLALATLAFTVFSIAMASVRLAGGWLMTAVGPRLTLTLGGALAAVSGLAMVARPSLPVAFLALIGIATGIAGAVPVTLHLATEHAGDRAREAGATDDRATAQALSRLGLATGGGYLAGGPLLGLVAALIGLRSSILLVAIGGAALAGCAGILGMWAHAGSRRELVAPPDAASGRSADPASVSTRELARARM
jgi:MFS family permease